MSEEKKIKLSSKQVFVIETIQEKGKYPVANNQNATAKKLITLGICEWNSGYDALVLTEKFKGANKITDL